MIKIAEEDHKRIQEIIGGMKCPKNFIFEESEFEDLGKVRDHGDENSLQCLEETASPCPFAGACNFGFQMRFCWCPLQSYPAKNLGK